MDHYTVAPVCDGGFMVAGPSQFTAALTVYAKDRTQADLIAYVMNQAFDAGRAKGFGDARRAGVVLDHDQCGAVGRLVDRSFSEPHSFRGQDKDLLWQVRNAISAELNCK